MDELNNWNFSEVEVALFGLLLGIAVMSWLKRLGPSRPRASETQGWANMPTLTTRPSCGCQSHQVIPGVSEPFYSPALAEPGLDERGVLS